MIAMWYFSFQYCRKRSFGKPFYRTKQAFISGDHEDGRGAESGKGSGQSLVLQSKTKRKESEDKFTPEHL